MKPKHTHDVASVVDREWRRLWQRLAELNGDLVATYPFLENQSVDSQQMCAALNNALESMNKADEALSAITQLMARRLH